MSVSWSIGGKTVQSLVIGNKEVQSIVRNSDGVVLYEKASAHNYSISFSQSSYTATGGACTISCTLLDNGSPVSGASISVTGSDGSVYTGITNQNGVASFSLTNLTVNVTYTCSYSNVSDTCIVLVQSNPVMNYNLTSYNVTCDSTIDSDNLRMMLVPVIDLEYFEFMEGHTLNDLNNPLNIPFDEMSGILDEYGIDYPVLWLDGSSWQEGISDFSELVDGLDILLLDLETYYEENLFILYCSLPNMLLKVEYTATDSNNLQAFVTNEVIGE